MNFTKANFIFLFFFLSISNIFAQLERPDTQRPKPPAFVIANAPYWAQEMYNSLPNVSKVDSAYTIWRKENPTELTYHTKYYKHWRRAVNSNVTEAGFWSPPNFVAESNTLREWKELRESDTARSTTWTSIGPFETIAEGETFPVSWQENIFNFEQSVTNANTLFCGTEGGAIFRSTDKGENWTNVSDGYDFGNSGDIAIDPTNDQIIYYGENKSGTNGLYKSIDFGLTWDELTNYPGNRVTRISINPSNNQIILVTNDIGLHRSTDGGASWTTIFTDYCWDIEIKTNDANTLFLLKTNPTTKICEFFKSTDQGQTWTLKDSGWIDASANDTSDNTDNGAKLGVSDADPDRVYAALIGQYNDEGMDNNYLGVYRSDDAGESWSLPNANANGGPGAPYADDHTCLVTFWFNDDQKYAVDGGQYNQGFYNMALDVSDTNADNFLVGFLNMFKSEDGGATFTHWGGYGGGPGWQHPDIQDIDIINDEVWVSSDGGLNKYAADFSTHVALNRGIAASDYWGFDGGWNEDILTGGRYHNGNSATILGVYPSGQYIRLGGAEAPTGYVHPSGGRKVMHSDINPKILPNGISGETSSFSFTAYPNQGYAGNNENSSELVPDPRCYNHLYLGSENKLMKSEDGGISWTTLYTFGSQTDDFVTGIEVSRSNPDVIYVLHRDSPTKLYKSTDGGATFTQTNSPSGATNNGAFITMSATDENKIWLAWSIGDNNTNKVFESSDGGNSWTNLTTNTLDGHYTEQLLHIAGTDDGLYWASNFGVFYRSDSEADWQACSDNLPVRARINRFIPFYRDSKVRLATYHRGLWEADMEETGSPIAQPTVDKLEAFCDRDTFYFDDYSVFDHSGASWSWSFSPTPQYVDDVTIRNPRVVFGNPGNYTATLTINGGSSKSIEVSLTAGCSADTIPGNALSLDQSGHATANGNLNLNSNTVTFTCWVKADANQNSWAPFMFMRGGSSTAGIGFGDDMNIRYHWDGGNWGFNTGHTVPADTWTHVALVITPSAATIYMNGVGVTNNSGHNAEAFDSPIILGYDPNSTARRFNGLIDEATVWDKALTQNEIRELMHLTLVPSEQPNLVSYYQVNEDTGVLLDRKASRHMSLVGTAGRSTSTGPFGGGYSKRMTVNSGGEYVFDNTGLTLNFPNSGTYPDGELCVTRINQSPDVIPNGEEDNGVYWVVNNYGTNTTFSALDQISFADYSVPSGAVANSYFLYKRPSNADGMTWPTAQDTADEIVEGSSGAVSFSTGNNITSFSQFSITSNEVLPVEWKSFIAVLEPDKTVDLHWSVFQTEEVSHFIIERSTDGSNFEKVGKVTAKFGSGDFAYKATDANPVRGENFYRLKQYDFDGTITFSLIRSVTIDALPNEWRLFPNPLPDNAALEIRTSAQGEYRLLLYSQKGKVVYMADLRGDASLDDLNLATGVYAYQILTVDGKWTGKILVE